MTIRKIAKILPVFLFLSLIFVQYLPAKGHWEFGFHYSQWSIDILRPMIEEGISDSLETELKEKILEDIQEDYPELREEIYNQSVRFDSGGNNYGFEIRWYPAGQQGSFSLGLSLEKTTMRVSLPEVSADLSVKNSITQEISDFEGNASGEFLLKPLSFHLSFRWDIIPSSKIRPYITFGLGAATGTALDNGELSYSYTGDLNVEGEEPEHYESTEKKTIKQLKDELEEEGEEFFVPGFLPFIQFSFGIKGAISDNVYVLVDAGIWDGFLIRGGIAFRL